MGQDVARLIAELLTGTGEQLIGCIQANWPQMQIVRIGKPALPALAQAVQAVYGSDEPPGQDDLVETFALVAGEHDVQALTGMLGRLSLHARLVAARAFLIPGYEGHFGPDALLAVAAVLDVGGSPDELVVAAALRKNAGKKRGPRPPSGATLTARRTLRLVSPRGAAPVDSATLEERMAAQAWLERSAEGFTFLNGTATLHLEGGQGGPAAPWIQIDFSCGPVAGVLEGLKSWLWLSRRLEMALVDQTGATVTQDNVADVAARIHPEAPPPSE